MNLVRVGDKVINLDNVTYMDLNHQFPAFGNDGPNFGVRLYFNVPIESESTADFLDFAGTEAEALCLWLHTRVHHTDPSIAPETGF